MPDCRNDIIANGTTSWPRSCPRCKFGPCQDPKYKESLNPRDKYAVLFNTTVHHDGDERNRTHPGHGYPAYSEDVPTIELFDCLDDLKEWIGQQDKYKKYTAIKYRPLKVSTEIIVDLN